MAENLKEQIDKLERELRELKENQKGNRFLDLSEQEVEVLRERIVERTAANVSGTSVSKYLIMKINGTRYAIPAYTTFAPIV